MYAAQLVGDQLYHRTVHFSMPQHGLAHAAELHTQQQTAEGHLFYGSMAWSSRVYRIWLLMTQL